MCHLFVKLTPKIFQTRMLARIVPHLYTNLQKPQVILSLRQRYLVAIFEISLVATLWQQLKLKSVYKQISKQVNKQAENHSEKISRSTLSKQM